MKDLSEIERAVPMSVLASVAAAVARLDAKPAGRAGWWRYESHGQARFARTAELAELGTFLADTETSSEAYSLWASSMPERDKLPALPSPITLARALLAADLAAWRAEGAPIANLEPDCEWSDRDIIARAGRAIRPATIERVRAHYRRLLDSEIKSEIAREHERLRLAHEELDAKARARALSRERREELRSR